jgi:hypothetical protein
MREGRGRGRKERGEERTERREGKEGREKGRGKEGEGKGGREKGRRREKNVMRHNIRDTAVRPATYLHYIAP